MSWGTEAALSYDGWFFSPKLQISLLNPPMVGEFSSHPIISINHPVFETDLFMHAKTFIECLAVPVLGR